jgi:hypothetical protein
MKPGQTDVKIAELLPFWVNGSLNADEAALVAAAVASDQSLAAEVDFLRGLRSQMQAKDAGYSPGEIGLARLRRSIAAQPAAAPKRRDVPLRVAAAAAVVAAIVGFAANQGFRPTAVEYIQASGGEDVPALIVAFKADATAQGLSDFLLAEGVVILDGPSAIGLYRLAPTDAATVDLAALAERLQARGDLFDVVDLPE